MAEEFVIAQGETGKPLRSVLTRGLGDQPAEDRPGLDLTAATRVDFYLNRPETPAATPLVSRQAAVEDAEEGLVRHAWQAADTQGLEPGVYLGQFRVTWAGGSTTHPDDEPIRVILTPFVG